MKVKALCAVLILVAVVSGYYLWPHLVRFQIPATQPTVEAARADEEGGVAESEDTKKEAAVAAETAEPAIPAQAVELAPALEQKSIAAEMIGNGRERLRVTVENTSENPLRIMIPVGQVFSGDRNVVIAVRPAEIEVAKGKKGEVVVQTAALRSTNEVAPNHYNISYRTIPKVELLLTYVQEHPELSPGAVQAAILALTDNLPLSAVAKFTIAGGALPSKFNTDAFRVETSDIISALHCLRAIGIPDHAIAMTIDPQLRIEAMIDPLSRPAAMRYYGIAPELEWEFWRAELMNGEPSTRHYALYGIARFYPEVALEMLPRWVRETRTNPVYRLSAAQALADTQKPEALRLLRQLAVELGEQTELGKATSAAAEYLDYRLAQLAAAQAAVAFRTGNTEAKF